ncbi:MAG: hypothetical protein ACLGHU_14110 [Alphaproteobacteria bacterium]
MVAGYTPNGLNRQTPGTNDNAWGDVLNDEVIQLVDEFIAGRAAFTLSGTKVLTSTNGVTNEARMAILHITGGTGGAIVIPARSKLYMVFNEASGDVTLAPTGGVAATVNATEAVLVMCDGTDCYSLGINGASWKEYVDQVAWSYNAGNLPAQTANAGKVVTTNGTDASWANVSALTDYINDQAAKAAAADKRAVAFAYFPRT